MKLKVIYLLFAMAIFFESCSDSAEEVETYITELQSLSTTVTENEAEIQAFLKTHFYNYEEFENPATDFDYRIKIDTIADTNTDKKPLFDFVQQQKINVSSSSFAGTYTSIADESNVSHTIYTLMANEGAGYQPTVVDSVYVDYEGMFLNGEIFDSSFDKQPLWFDLQGTQTYANSGSFIKGFEVGLTKFKAGTPNDDDSIALKSSGIGLIIMPSALAYYNSTVIGKSYAPIIFEVQLLSAKETDHDNDGIRTLDELEVDNNFDITLTDTDGDGVPDYLQK